MMTYLQGIGTAVPQYKYSQECISAYMQDHSSGDLSTKRKIKILHRKSGIAFRHSVLPDFYGGESTLFLKDKTVLVADKMEVFMKESVALGLAAVNNLPSNIDLNQVSHLIAVSCTGMWAPGLELALSNQLNLNTSIERFGVNFMGCYAAFHAFKIADYIVKAKPKAQVLVVCVELCTIHFNHLVDDDQLRANALFADGAAAAIISGKAQESRFSLNQFFTELIPNGSKDMAWTIQNHGFQMNLSSYIPQLISSGMKPLLEKIMPKEKNILQAIKHWALHPGGLKILSEIEKELQLPSDALSNSKQVLNNFGNMSSVTILFVLQQFMEKENLESGTLFAAGFGPGLTIETALIDVL